jgi:hypothetical protein
MATVTSENCTHCGQYLANDPAGDGRYIAHEGNDCIKALVEEVERLSHRVDELESKESSRSWSEGHRDYH